MWAITGSEGFIGRHLGIKLAGKARGFDIKLGRDCSSFDAVWYGFEGVHTVAHLAAEPGVQQCLDNPLEAAWTNDYMTAIVLQAALQRDVQRFLFASSAAAAYATHPYGASKAAGEAWCRAYTAMGLPCTVLRLANVYGPCSDAKTSCVASWMKEALTYGTVSVFGDGKQSRDFICVYDVANAFLKAVDVPCGTYSVATGVQTPIIEVAEWIAKATGARIHHWPAREGDAFTSPAERSEVVPERTTALEEGLSTTLSYFRKKLC